MSTIAEKKKPANKPKKALPLQKIERNTPANAAPKVERFFIVDFTISWKTSKDGIGNINDSIKVGPLASYPNKTSIIEQLPELYNIKIGENDITETNVYNIRPWELTKQDWLEFTQT